MTATVRADPAHPHGGHALLSVPGDRAPAGATPVAIFSVFDSQYLGPNGWQTAPATIGPLEPRREGDRVVYALGPELVDRVEEFTPLRLTIGDLVEDLTWPEDIPMSPSRAVGGGLAIKRDEELEAKKGPTTIGGGPGKDEGAPRRAAEPPKREPEAPRKPPEPVPPLPTEEEETKPRSLLPYLLAGLAALALAGAVYWYVSQPGETRTATVAEPPPVPVAVGCSDDDLRGALDLPLDAALALVSGCAAEGDAELRYAVIDRGVREENAAALLLLGRWYDPAEADAVGSNFTERDPALALDYYARARDAGAAEAEPLVASACAALDVAGDPLHESSHMQHCGGE